MPVHCEDHLSFSHTILWAEIPELYEIEKASSALIYAPPSLVLILAPLLPTSSSFCGWAIRVKVCRRICLHEIILVTIKCPGNFGFTEKLGVLIPHTPLQTQMYQEFPKTSSLGCGKERTVRENTLRVETLCLGEQLERGLFTVGVTMLVP